MNRAIFSEKIISTGQFFEQRLPLIDKKDEEITPAGLVVPQSFAVMDLWKIRICQGYTGNSTTAL